MGNPKLLHIITGLSMGGAERALYSLLAGGLGASFQCDVVSLWDQGVYGERIGALGVPVHTLEMRRGSPSIKGVRQLHRLMRTIQPDLVQGWMYHGNLAASVARWVAPKRPPLAWNVRHSLYGLSEEKPMTRQVIRANRLLSRGVDAVLYNSRVSREQHEAFGFSGRSVQVIPNGFDLQQWCPDPKAGRAYRENLNIPGDARVVGHVARFHPMKNHAGFLRAAVRVARLCADVRFVLVGRNVALDNPALAGCVPGELQERFHFVGEHDDVAKLMRLMDVLCMSSEWGDAFPNVLGEAMAVGVPCVATDVGDSRDIVADTGVVVPPGDAKALAEGLLALLSKPLEERRALGKAARLRIEKRYDLAHVVERYAAVYQRLLTSVIDRGSMRPTD